MQRLNKETVVFTLPVNGPFDPRRLTHNLKVTSFGLPYTVTPKETVIRSFRLGQSLIIASVDLKAANTQQELEIEVSFSEPPDSEEETEQRIRRLLTHIFGIDDGLDECYAALSNDPVLAALVRRQHGLRLVRAPGLFETLFTVILGQQISVAAANAQRRRLLAFYSTPIPHGPHQIEVMPDSGRIGDTNATTFRGLGISRQKARYLREAALWDSEGRLEAETLGGFDDAAAVDYLRGIPGVGLWTAQIVLMRALGRLDVFPAGDVGLQNVVQALYGLDSRPDAQRLADFSQRWKGWRSYAALYLWMHGIETSGQR